MSPRDGDVAGLRTSEQAIPCSLFDYLSVDDVRNIHVHLSNKPNHPRWFAFISSRDWTACLHPASPRFNVARAALSKLEVSVYNVLTETESRSSFSQESVQRRRLAPSGCHTVMLLEQVPLKLPWNLPIATNADILRYVDLSLTETPFFVEEVLARTRGQLVALTISMNHHQLIASYCRGLRELCLARTMAGSAGGHVAQPGTVARGA